MDNRDAIAPGQSRPVNIDAPDDPQISWGGMTNVTQASVHPALGQVRACVQPPELKHQRMGTTLRDNRLRIINFITLCCKPVKFSHVVVIGSNLCPFPESV